MKIFHMFLLSISIICTSGYSLTTKVSDELASQILDLASDSIDRIEEERVYFKPDTVHIIGSEIYVYYSFGSCLPIPIIESTDGELFITLGCPEKVIYECRKCGKKYYPNPPARCSCGSTSFKAKIDVVP